DPRQRTQAEAVRHLAGGDQQGSAPVRQRRRVARGDLPLDLREAGLIRRGVERGLQSGQRLDSGSRTDDLVRREPGDRGQFVVESALFGCRRSLFVATRGELVELLARETPLRGDQLRADTLRHKAFGVALRHLTERVAARQHTGAHRDPAHRLDARGDHDVVSARDDALGGEADGLLAAAALTVDRRARHTLREACAQQRVARDVDGLIAHLGDRAGDDVVDLDRIDPAPADQFLQTVRQKVDGQHVVQRAAGLALADRGAYRSDDDRLAAYVSGHCCLLYSPLSSALYIQL